MQTKGTKQICDNRQARHEYFILERYEAGIALQGNEVKSIRLGHVNLKDAWCDITDGELYVKGMHISPYEKDGLFRTDPMRVRKLLMHHQEILRLFGKVKQDGLTLVPLSLYFKDSRVKVQVGLCKGKKLYDKRQTSAKQDAPDSPCRQGAESVISLTSPLLCAAFGKQVHLLYGGVTVSTGTMKHDKRAEIVASL